MDIRGLRYFVAVAEAGSISRAAERCRVRQPSMSQQIGRLEGELGVALFDRLGRGVALTDAGRALLDKARGVLARVNELESAVRADVERGGGRLVLGAIPTMAPYLAPALVAGLREEHPQCEVIVHEDLTQGLLEGIADNRIDVAIMSTTIGHELVELETVGAEPFMVVAPADHPVCGAGDIALADLRMHPAVTLSEMHCLGRQIGEFCKARRLGANVVCRTAQIGTLLEFVRLGLGLSIVPAMVAAHDKHPGRKYLRFRRAAPTREIALAWRTGRRRSRLALRLAALLGERLSGGGAGGAASACPVGA